MNKLNLTLIALVVALASALGLLGKLAWDKRELGRANSALNEQLMQSKLEIGRAHTQFGDANKYVGELETAIQNEIKERDAVITQYSKLEAKLDIVVKSKGKGKIRYIQGPKTKGDKFQTGMWYVAFDERTLLPVKDIVGLYKDDRIDIKCSHSPDAKEEVAAKYEYNLHMTFGGQLLSTRTPSGAINNYVTIWELNKKGKRLRKLELAEFVTIVTDDRAPKFHWWAPHVDVGIISGLSNDVVFGVMPSLGVSFMGYGLTKNDLEWRFLRINGALGNDLQFGLDPAMYNLGTLLPLFSNLWVGPHVSYGFLDRKLWFGLTLGAVL